jgi:hypothetical protein
MPEPKMRELTQWEEIAIMIRVFLGINLLWATYHLTVRPALWLLMMARPGAGELHNRLAMYDMECRYGGRKKAEMVLGFGRYLAEADLDRARKARLVTLFGELVPDPDPNEITRPRRTRQWRTTEPIIPVNLDQHSIGLKVCPQCGGSGWAGE